MLPKPEVVVNQDHKLALVVPYRNREEHLRQFLPHIKRYLDEQQITHQLYVIEQAVGRLFNKGVLLNAGYLEADPSCDYFVFHDVDMLPVDVDYSFEETPTHLASAASQFGDTLPYEGYFGGVTLFSRKSFELANGYSNEYWGWGAEDDDMLFRCHLAGMVVQRKSPGILKSLDHDRLIERGLYEKNMARVAEMRAGKSDWKNEGLNSCQYRVLNRDEATERIHIRVSF